jgi:alpha-L-fucosidase 2
VYRLFALLKVGILQSYQKNIQVFPDWPVDQDASFDDLLAVGNVLVSSNMSGGELKMCTLPARSAAIAISQTLGHLTRQYNCGLRESHPGCCVGRVLTIPTVRGDMLLFAPLAK